MRGTGGISVVAVVVADKTEVGSAAGPESFVGSFLSVSRAAVRTTGTDWISDGRDGPTVAQKSNNSGPESKLTTTVLTVRPSSLWGRREGFRWAYRQRRLGTRGWIDPLSISRCFAAASLEETFHFLCEFRLFQGLLHLVD